MSKDIYIFKRIEKKYQLNLNQKEKLLQAISTYLIPDSHGKSTIYSLYLDNENHLLIRNSIDAKSYKEKLRIRSYGIPKENTKVFFEIKKKFEGIVYKRRVSMKLKDALDYVNYGQKPIESQIMNEIDYAMKFYKQPKPSILVIYKREAYYATDYPNLRLTFDSSVHYKQDDFFDKTSGQNIVTDDQFILEIKTDGSMPLWLSHALDKYEIKPSSFSKVGTAYLDTLLNH